MELFGKTIMGAIAYFCMLGFLTQITDWFVQDINANISTLEGIALVCGIIVAMVTKVNQTTEK